MSDTVFVRPPIEYYPNGPDGRPPCLWRLNKAMYGLKQSPRLWQEHYASVMKSLGFRCCKSDPNLYCHSSKQLYVLAYVDDLLIAGDSDKAQEFIEALNKELLVKVTAKLDAGTGFLGRRLRHNGDSIDLFMPQTYVDELLALYSMKDSNCVSTMGTASLKRLKDSDQALDKTEHAKYRTAVGKLLWMAFVRPDCSFAVKELSRDVKGPTQESLSRLKHLLRYISGTRATVLRLRPTQMLGDWHCTVDVTCYVDSDWAGCHKTRRSTSGSLVQVLDCSVIHTSRTQATVALSSGEAELYAIGQGINEALFVKNIILEAEFARKVNIVTCTDSTAGKSMATRFGAGKRTKHVELRYFYVASFLSKHSRRTRFISNWVCQRFWAEHGIAEDPSTCMCRTMAEDFGWSGAPVGSSQFRGRPCQSLPYIGQSGHTTLWMHGRRMRLRNVSANGFARGFGPSME